MASNRMYGAHTCPFCDNEFYPYRSDQIYCTPQCRKNYNNDRRKEEKRERYGLEPVLRQSDEALEVLLKSHFYQNELIEESALLGFGIDLNLCTLEKNLDTGRPIRWFHAYGVELVDRTNRLFTIHHRTNFN